MGAKTVIKRIITLEFWNEAIFSSQRIIRCHVWIVKLHSHTYSTIYHIKFAFICVWKRNIKKIKLHGNSISIWPFDLANDLKILTYVCWCPESFGNVKLLAKHIPTKLCNFHVLKSSFFWKSENIERIMINDNFELAYGLYMDELIVWIHSH